VPILIVLVAVLVLALLAVILTPLTLFMRYRTGRARRRARSWVATFNLASLALAVVLLLTSAAVAAFWAPLSARYALAGLAGGAALGLLGLFVTRWEPSPGVLHYTPNAGLVLVVTLVVAARIAWGAWRAWEAWTAGLDHTTWVVVSGVRGSFAAGGVVLGYYLVFWAGVRRKARRVNA
jgi:hypothetical protein